jgi:hypothetical protein
MGMPSGTLLDMVCNVDARQQYIFQYPKGKLSEMTHERLTVH